MHDEQDRGLDDRRLPEDLKRCIAFHGHLCPGLVYGYLVARHAIEALGFSRSHDEEVVVISENDTCAVDALQVMLGTTVGKGNLMIKDYGKNAFTVFNRSDKRAFRFLRTRGYRYDGAHQQEYERLEQAYASGHATAAQRRRQKWLKALDLLEKPFDKVFETRSVEWFEPPYAPLAPSKACDRCGEMTMATRMVQAEDGQTLCIPCACNAGLSGP
ncbi:MAG: TraR/DksA C4-type zinc finger protein [Deltaproteobacteria bacterium]|nr:TraR/DksA C4-type zinc finger protein [Deltaproteobacteria bacterium]